ncbi:hypothetical protein AB0L05_20680 [Nonomuraea pusilla]|uniref:hypothetical protein n=1 Tax=Nonomuraea pusilla TaxID=46177 RepID=UPI003327FAE6
MPSGKTFGLGTLLSGVNPQNLALAVAAAPSIAEAGLAAGGTTVAILVYVVLGILTAAGPVPGFLPYRDRKRCRPGAGSSPRTPPWCSWCSYCWAS